MTTASTKTPAPEQKVEHTPEPWRKIIWADGSWIIYAKNPDGTNTHVSHYVAKEADADLIIEAPTLKRERDELLKVGKDLSDFARTAPGRLPSYVQEALVTVARIEARNG